MGLFEHFPYTNFHELNLDSIVSWIADIKPAVKKMLAWPINATENSDGLAFGKEATESELVDSEWDISAPTVEATYFKTVLPGDTSLPASVSERGIEFDDVTGRAGRIMMTYRRSAALDKRVYNRFSFLQGGFNPTTGERTPYRDYYNLPDCPLNNTEDAYYMIWTTKEIPAPPTADGEYTLKATVSDGAVTYSWE